MDAINQTVKDKGYGFLTADQKALYNQSQPAPKVATPPVQSPNVINSSVLSTPVTQTNFQQAVPPPPVQLPPIPVPEPASAPLSLLEQRMQAESDKALAANDALVGRSAYASEQQNLAGVGEQSKLQKELTAQLVAIGNEAKAIPLKAQEQALGRGVTAGGLAPIEAASTRQNAIQALTLNSQLSAVQGNLQNAMDMADRAVEAKYGPIEAQYKTSLTNLDLISKSPQYTAEQKARANAMAEQQQAKLDAIATEKENAQAVSDALIKTISYNKGIDQMSIRALNAAKSPAEFAAIANYLGLETMSPQDKADLEYKQAQTDALGMKTYGGSSSGGGSVTDANGNTVSGFTSGDSPITAAAKDWIAQFNSGLMSIEDIYAKIGSAKESLPLRNEVARLVGLQKGKRVYGADDASVQAIQSQIKNIDDLLESNQYKKIVGLIQGGAGVFPDRWNVGKQDAIAIAKNLTSNQTLQALADAKSKGITFGALSEKELGVVAESASRIAAKLKEDKNKNVIGFTGSEKQFREDLETIKKGLQNAVASKTQASNTNSPDDDLLSQFGL
jgi:hypothetical protein